MTLEELCKRYIEKPTCARYDVLAYKVVKLSEGKIAHVVHGHWDYGDDMFEYAICSSCNWDSGEAWEYAKKNFKFCPNCGAKMDE